MPIQTRPWPARISLALALVLATGLTQAAADTRPPIQERMTDAQFKAYGLDKLSVEELKGLNTWLRGEMSAAKVEARNEPAVANDAKAGFRSKETERVEVKAHLTGAFSGWSGSTIFKLDNGQEWQQVEPGAYSGQRIENAAITIKPKMMGNWLLVVDYCQCRIGVTRIK